ncbi:MAG: putative glycoside hydrolase, partial [Patescibacteria group bacterium]
MTTSKKQKKYLVKKRFAIAFFIIGLFIVYFFNFSLGGIIFEYSSGDNGDISKKKIVHHIKTPNEVRGIYMTSWVASTESIRNGLIKIAEETEVNSIIVDIKDYTGKVAFLMDNPKIKEFNSSENRIKDIKDFIKELHDKNIYVIGRIAVFQDPFLSKVRPDLYVKRKDGVNIWKDY